MISKPFLIIAATYGALQPQFLSNAPVCGPAQALLCDSLAQDNGEVSGVYNGVIFGSDGWAYFTLGTTQMRMKTADFPDPIPFPGTKWKATGCTPDPNFDGGYICTGLQAQ
jgi:hypothetical protein